MKKIKIGLILALISALISALIAVFAMVGCNESKLNTGTNTLNPNISALNAKGGLQVSLNFIKKSMSTKASDISDVIDSVTFHITGANLPAPINQTVQRADFKGPGWAVIQINDLLPGTINVTVEAKDASGNVIATGHQDNITVIPGDTIRIRIDCVINVGSVIIDFVCINCLPTPTVTIPASIAPPSPMPTVCCTSPPPTSPPPANGNILVYVNYRYQYTKTNFSGDLPLILAERGYTVTLKDRNDEIITQNLLDPYSQLWIMQTGADFSSDEINLINLFRNNHGVLIAAEHTDFIGGINVLSNLYGGNFFDYIARGDEATGSIIIKNIPNHPILNSVDSVVGLSTEAKVSFTTPTLALAENPDGEPFVGILDDANKGRVVFETSFARFTDGYSLIGNTPQYIKNIADWLARVTN